MDRLEMKSIADLQGMSFYIPAYQRGYRWTQLEVRDLLNDIFEFSKKNCDSGIYCLQPLVVAKRTCPVRKDPKEICEAEELSEYTLKEQWEVVDGQQRLTTIRIILEVLQQSHFYDIEYATRLDSADFLNRIMDKATDAKDTDNIDYYHIKQAADMICKCLEGKDTDHFRKVLLNQVKFVWYETREDDPKEIFTRLNIGKISLTNAELIKALLLNKTNFETEDYGKIRLRQQEIAMEWDVIEYSLQSDDFWLFLNKPGNERPTRIDFIFDLICQEDMLRCKDKMEEVLQTNDKLKTFRYFNRYIEAQEQKEKAIRTIWGKVKDVFQTMQEWFDDMELYHYIGYLICIGNENCVNDIYREWTKYSTKLDFRKKYLVDAIRRTIPYKDVENTVYEADTESDQEIKGGSKRNCLPILLLHNLQSVINHNKALEENCKYGKGVFYKFPFHLYKSEGWDVEHIDSNTENLLNDIRSQREWLLNAYFGLQGEHFKEIRESIKYIGKNYEQSEDPAKQEKRDRQFRELQEKIDAININLNARLSQTEKNKIWNFTLLDSSTNRSYGNAIFPAKRRAIIGKDQGKRFLPPTVDENGQLAECQEKDGQSSFIPPCTKSVFLKYYNSASSDPNTWNKEDARAYMNNIKETLKEFLS